MTENLCDYLLLDEGNIFCQCKFLCEYQTLFQQLHVAVDYELTEALRALPTCSYYEVN